MAACDYPGVLTQIGSQADRCRYRIWLVVLEITWNHDIPPQLLLFIKRYTGSANNYSICATFDRKVIKAAALIRS